MERERLERLIGRRGVTLTDAEWSDVYDAPIRALLTEPEGNAKVAKGLKLEDRPVSTAILHLSPADGSGLNTCPKATDGCRTACLNTAGRGGMALDSDGLNTIQRARRRRTLQYFARRPEFMRQLHKEIARHIRRAEDRGFVPAIRLNGTSDIKWENEPVTLESGETFPNLMSAFSTIQFYDYTKRTDRENLPSNYHLTFSLAESNEADADAMIKRGVNVAVVIATPRIRHFNGVSRFASKVPMPETFKNLPLVDGDISDVRFRDPSGVYVGLRAKGRALKDATGFVRDLRDACETTEDN